MLLLRRKEIMFMDASLRAQEGEMDSRGNKKRKRKVSE